MIKLLEIRYTIRERAGCFHEKYKIKMEKQINLHRLCCTAYSHNNKSICI